MRFQVILDTRHGGSSYGTTDDVIEADSPDAAEQSAIEQWTALRPTCTFHPLLTIELADETPAALDDSEHHVVHVDDVLLIEGNAYRVVANDLNVTDDKYGLSFEEQVDGGTRHAYGDYGKFYRVLNFTGYGDDFVNFADALAFAKTKFHSSFVEVSIAERVRDEHGEREVRRVKVPNPLKCSWCGDGPDDTWLQDASMHAACKVSSESGALATRVALRHAIPVDGAERLQREVVAQCCTEHEAGECFAGCPNAYTSIDREHRFAEGDLICHVDAPHEAAVVSELTWRVVDSVAYPTYTLSDRAPLTMDEVVEDVLDDADLVAFTAPRLINGAVEVPIDTSKTNDQHEAASTEGR